MNHTLVALPLALFATCFVACADNAHPQTADELRTEQGAKRTDQRTNQKIDRIDLAADQEKDASDARSERTKAQADLEKERADNGAELEKARVDDQADRSKFDAELRGRLDKVDVRIADASAKATSSKPAHRARVTEMLKGAREQRVSLGDSYARLKSVTDKQWEPTKEQIVTRISTLETDVARIEELLSAS